MNDIDGKKEVSLPAATQRLHRLLVILHQILMVAVFAVLVAHYMPNANGKMGHDYSYFLPSLLDGLYWFRVNGWFEVPWFSPSFCGGVPAFPNPQHIYYSIPQLLSFLIGPLTAAYTTTVLFAWIGYVGTYLLLRRDFGVGRASATLAASIFLWNGFFLHRMLVGHLALHPFMLCPLLAHVLLRPTPTLIARLAQGSCGGMLLAYMLYGGMVHLLVPSVLSIVIIACIYALVRRSPKAFVIGLIVSGSTCMALTASKLLAVSAFLRHFPRDMYTLPGVRSLHEGLILIARALFWEDARDYGSRVMVNLTWALEPHEYEYGLTLAPVAVWIVLLVSAARGRSIGALFAPMRKRWYWALALVTLLLIPLLLNWYTSQWNAALKTIPVLGNSATLIRWYAVYLLPASVLTGLAMERLPLGRGFQMTVFAAATLILLGTNFLHDRQHYAKQGFDPSYVELGFQASRTLEFAPRIDYVAIAPSPDPAHGAPPLQNDSLVLGISPLRCYEPIFGYRLENLPLDPIQEGRIEKNIGGVFNLKNPVCYVYPRENDCRPGANFEIDEQDKLRAFSGYRPYAFNSPMRQRVANWISLGSWVGCCILLLYCVIGVLQGLRRS